MTLSPRTPAPQPGPDGDGTAAAPFGLYLHVPFCASRCGYCDFNTYTPGELGSRLGPDSYLEAVAVEVALAAEATATALGELPEVNTIFVGGGTPSMLGHEGLSHVMDLVRGHFTLRPGAEVTTESNPESTSPAFFAGLLQAGYTRVSLGMQSAAPHVLKVLERRHTPGRAVAAAREAAAAGFEHLNLDVIYGTPGEEDRDLQATLEAILDTPVDHVSAYSLIVEDGTAMARKVAKGQLPAPDEDVLARRYRMIDDTLRAAGMDWYEVSNWARPGGACAHNLGYWRGGNWWGIGPGAHSHLDGRRFFNVKHPGRYNDMLGAGELPIAGEETLDADARHMEDVMLRLRLAEGLPEHLIADDAAGVVASHLQRGLLRRSTDTRGVVHLVLTDAGRLLADGIVTDILAAE
ncbi:coproporphyrinogen III oxidase [Corynebacterium sp. 13CS0277]|uniref:radical SAM family heme chaperone HemW n=1 Tax=Corynebacterium sp. 13CS0277 TaxID=2071994 RepID=UPI000D03134C|nr:radical SAM family heme chaperone HemW [Corynebacterium sp. 13CS0277]PRQ10891.1 coproporphyrinogen III oxidase [Corynebacterium sp. 13CS0277]